MKPCDYYQYLVDTYGVAAYICPQTNYTFPEQLFIEAGLDQAEREAVRSAGREMEADPLLRQGGWVNLIVRELFSLLTDKRQQQMRDIIFAGEFPTGDFNAHAVKVPDENAYVFLVNVGLLSMLHDVAKVVVFSKWTTRGDKMEPVTQAMKNSKELVDNEANRYFRDLIANYISFKMYVRPERRFAPSGKDNVVADFLALEAYRFVLAHEVAHVVLGHLASAKTSFIHINRDGSKIPVINKSMKEELYADTLGWKIIMANLLKNREKLLFEGPLLFAGPFFFLGLADIIEKAECVEPTTHPPAHIRSKVLEEFMNSTLPRELFETCNSVSKKILGQLQKIARSSKK